MKIITKKQSAFKSIIIFLIIVFTADVVIGDYAFGLQVNLEKVLFDLKDPFRSLYSLRYLHERTSVIKNESADLAEIFFTIPFLIGNLSVCQFAFELRKDGKPVNPLELFEKYDGLKKENQHKVINDAVDQILIKANSGKFVLSYSHLSAAGVKIKGMVSVGKEYQLQGQSEKLVWDVYKLAQDDNPKPKYMSVKILGRVVRACSQKINTVYMLWGMLDTVALGVIPILCCIYNLPTAQVHFILTIVINIVFGSITYTAIYNKLVLKNLTKSLNKRDDLIARTSVHGIEFLSKNGKKEYTKNFNDSKLSETGYFSQFLVLTHELIHYACDKIGICNEKKQECVIYYISPALFLAGAAYRMKIWAVYKKEIWKAFRYSRKKSVPKEKTESIPLVSGSIQQEYQHVYDKMFGEGKKEATINEILSVLALCKGLDEKKEALNNMNSGITDKDNVIGKEFIEVSKTFISHLISDKANPVFIRVCREDLESFEPNELALQFEPYLNRPNIYICLYAKNDPDKNIDKSKYPQGLEIFRDMRPLPRVKMSKENTITLIFKDKRKYDGDNNKEGKKDLVNDVSIRNFYKDSIPVFVQERIRENGTVVSDDLTGIVRGVFMGLRYIYIARQLNNKGIVKDENGEVKFENIKDQPIGKFVKETCDLYKGLIKGYQTPGLSDDAVDEFTPQHILDTVSSLNVNRIAKAALMMIRLLPVKPFSVEELKILKDLAGAVMFAA